MDIKISASNVFINSALTKHIEAHLSRHITKYFENAVNANVYFSKEGNSVCVKIIVNEGVKGGGIDIKSDAIAVDIYAAFNEAVEKVAKQLRRYKRKIKNYRRKKRGLKAVNIRDRLFEQSEIAVPIDFANLNLKDKKEFKEKSEENAGDISQIICDSSPIIDILNQKFARIDEIQKEQEKLRNLLLELYKEEE